MEGSLTNNSLYVMGGHKGQFPTKIPVQCEHDVWNDCSKYGRLTNSRMDGLIGYRI